MDLVLVSIDIFFVRSSIHLKFVVIPQMLVLNKEIPNNEFERQSEDVLPAEPSQQLWPVGWIAGEVV